MHIYLPIRPKKGQSFKLSLALNGTSYFTYSQWSSDSKIPFNGFVSLANVNPASVKISKDGNSFVQTTNAPQAVESGGYIELTADEMNADIIQFFIVYTSTYSYYAYNLITIYTDSEEINYGNLKSLLSKLFNIFK